MANGALAQVESLGSMGFVIFSEAAGPRQIVGVDVENSALGIDRLASPLRSAVEAGEDDGFFVETEGNELALAAECFELIDRPLMHLGRARAENIGGEKLSREGRGFGGQALLGGGLLSGHRAWRIFLAFERKHRRAVGAIEKINESLLGSLGEGVDLFSVVIDGEKNRRRGKVAVPHIVVH